MTRGQKVKCRKYDHYGVLFLDIDGVICTERAGYSTDPHNVWRNFDPIAIGMVRNLCDQFQLKIVASSTWRMGGGDIIDLKTVLSTHGIGEFYFFSGKNWRTENTGSRSEEIQNWLDKNKNVTRYIILDDDNFFKDTRLEKRFIQTNCRDGISSKNYLDAKEKLRGMK